MRRTLLAVVSGFVTWTVLWLSANAGLSAALPGAFREDGSTDRPGLLLLILVLSVVFSLITGFLTAMLDRERGLRAAWILGSIQLAVGIAVQTGYWAALPLWYHLSFLAFLLPGILAGARGYVLRSSGTLTPPGAARRSG